MSHRNLEYLVNYIGPVLFVKKQKVEYKDEKRKLYTCSNKNCSKHGKDLYARREYCVKCGHKIEYIECLTGERYETWPFDVDEKFDNFYVLMNNKASNGISSLNKNITLADDEIVFVPYFNTDTTPFNCGILNYVELGKYCKNKECENFDECLPFKHDYCGDCGKKNKIKRDGDLYSSFPLKDAKSILKLYETQSILSECRFINDSTFDKVVLDFEQSEMCKLGIKCIEKAYGKGSVTIRLAFIQYHQNY